ARSRRDPSGLLGVDRPRRPRPEGRARLLRRGVARYDAVKVLDAPDVAWVAWKVDGGLTVQAWTHEVKREVETLAHVLGREPTWHGVSRSRWTGTLSGL